MNITTRLKSKQLKPTSIQIDGDGWFSKKLFQCNHFSKYPLMTTSKAKGLSSCYHQPRSVIWWVLQATGIYHARTVNMSKLLWHWTIFWNVAAVTCAVDVRGIMCTQPLFVQGDMNSPGARNQSLLYYLLLGRKSSCKIEQATVSVTKWWSINKLVFCTVFNQTLIQQIC